MTRGINSGEYRLTEDLDSLKGSFEMPETGSVEGKTFNYLRESMKEDEFSLFQTLFKS